LFKQHHNTILKINIPKPIFFNALCGLAQDESYSRTQVMTRYQHLPNKTTWHCNILLLCYKVISYGLIDKPKLLFEIM